MSRYAWCTPYGDSLLITALGKSITRDELFQYTNGRFLVRERQQRDFRYVKFDLEKLCEIAASAGHSVSPVRAVEKLEGGFSKALLIQKEDGTELVAKIPCPNAGPARYITASEVAVLEYVRTNTKIPVPNVYAWDCDPSNPVGAEYIIMEKAAGVQLFKVWDQIEEPSKLALTKRLTEWESQLMSIRFPAYGSLYFSHSIPENDERVPLPVSLDPTRSYCIGRSCDPSWSFTQQNLTPGPWSSFTTFGAALAKREKHRILTNSKYGDIVLRCGTARDQIALLETTIELMQILGSHPNLVSHTKPTLCHTDLHMGNIFVSKDDPLEISSIIDWQSTQVAPLFLQARWPVFLQPPKDYLVGLVKPELPENFEQLDAEEKELAKYKFKQVMAAKAYEVRSFLDNQDAYNAMNIPRVFRELFVRCGETWEQGSAPLRACLVEISKSWHELGLLGDCPFMFDEGYLRKHEIQFEEYQEWHHTQEFAREYLDTDADGWISPEVDFDKKLEQNKALFNLFSEKMSAHKSPEEICKMWPFPEGV